MRVLCESRYIYSLLLLVPNWCNSGDAFLSILVWWKSRHVYEIWIWIRGLDMSVLSCVHYIPCVVVIWICAIPVQSLECNNRGLFFGTLLNSSVALNISFGSFLLLHQAIINFLLANFMALVLTISRDICEFGARVKKSIIHGINDAYICCIRFAHHAPFVTSTKGGTLRKKFF